MRHHYVPQFYLRKFAESDGRVRRYRLSLKEELEEHPVSPKSTAYEDDLYTTASGNDWDTWDPDIIEKKVMGPIDDAGAKVMAKLCRRDELTDEERTAWALFLNSLRYRHADEILEHDKAIPEVLAQRMPTYPEPVRQAIANGDFDAVQMAKTAHRTVMVQEMRKPEAVSKLKAMRWHVVDVDPKAPLLTTDRPLHVNLGKGGTPEILTIALSPTLLFVAYPAEWETDPEMKKEVAETRENLAVAHDLTLMLEQPCECIYTSRPLDDEMVIGDKKFRLRTAAEAALKKWRKD